MSRSRGPVAGLDIVTLARGYPPVLGAMLLVDGVLTLILGGDATVSLGEVVAYLVLPPLAMFLLTQLTGGRRPSAVTLGVGVAGAAVLVAALFLLGGVDLVTLPGWVLVLLGLALLGVAVVLMRRAAPAREEPPVPPLLNRDERASFSDFSDDPVSGGSHSGSHPASTFAEYGAGPGGPDRPAESEWPPRRDDEQSRTYSGTRAADDTVAGLPRVPADPAPGPSEPDWPPRRDPVGTRPSWDDRDDARADWSAGNGAGWSAGNGAGGGAGGGADWSAGNGPGGGADWSTGHGGGGADWSTGGGAGSGSAWSDGPADREWPPSSGRDWPPRRDPEPSPAAGPRSWFETDETPSSEAGPAEAGSSEAGPAEAGPAGSSWQPGPPDSEWPPADRTYRSGGRRSRHPDQ
ncbi:hypothetical protein [Virgisporangium ochraceum]|uniref:Uncharacterized protein n=1 Tax=Virgisporangium ochraceum TaxID=65505 RepID=A0A8J4EEV0_9ACTN|nr:hypothetical protein [Virgisporangium ochraceum]GIJ72013.1 hypothetical protein Voc01_069300 [Virgisporangium ochraceum]